MADWAILCIALGFIAISAALFVRALRHPFRRTAGPVFDRRGRAVGEAWYRPGWLLPDPGRLHLNPGRLSFAWRDGEPAFDIGLEDITEIKGPGLAPNLEIRCGSTRYKLGFHLRHARDVRTGMIEAGIWRTAIEDAIDRLPAKRAQRTRSAGARRRPAKKARNTVPGS